MKKAFTLIELLVVVLIIGILAAVALPQYEKAVAKSRMAELFLNLQKIDQMVEMYKTEHRLYSETGMSLCDMADVTSIELAGRRLGQDRGYECEYITKNFEFTGYLMEDNLTFRAENSDFSFYPYMQTPSCFYHTNLGRFYCTELKNQKQYQYFAIDEWSS